MQHRVARGISRIRKAVGNRGPAAVTLEQWLSERTQDTGPHAWSTPRDHLRLVKSSSEPQIDALNVLARLEAENRSLRDRAVDLALSIQLLQQRAQQ